MHRPKDPQIVEHGLLKASQGVAVQPAKRRITESPHVYARPDLRHGSQRDCATKPLSAICALNMASLP